MNTGKVFTCFNTNGINTWGKPFTKVVIVEQGKVQPMWVGNGEVNTAILNGGESRW